MIEWKSLAKNSISNYFTFFKKTISCRESIICLMPEVDQLFFMISLPVDDLCISWSKNMFKMEFDLSMLIIST